MADSAEERVQAGKAKWEAQYRLAFNAFIPWTPWNVPAKESTVALVTTGGAYLKRGLHQPFDTESPAGDPSFREFPSVVESEDIAVAHSSGNCGFAEEDINVVFPVTRLNALATGGYIGSAAPFAYSFMGNVKDPTDLLANYAPNVAYRMKRMGADVALVVAAHPMDSQVAALVARTIELAGVPTVVLGTDRDLLQLVRAPRAVVVAHPDGAPLGEPGNGGKHQAVIRSALQTAWTFEAPGRVADLELS